MDCYGILRYRLLQIVDSGKNVASPKRVRLTVHRLNELLRYDKRTGELTWRVNRGRTAKAGDDAGTLRKDGVIILTVDGRQYMANRLVWFMVTGEWPLFRLTSYDKNPANLRFSNLVPEEETWKNTRVAAYNREYRRRQKLLAEGKPPYFEFDDPHDPRPVHRRHNAPRMTDAGRMHDRIAGPSDATYEAFQRRRAELANADADVARLEALRAEDARRARARATARARQARYRARKAAENANP